MKTTQYSFRSGYDKYRRTCDIQQNIKIYNEHADVETKGLDYKVNTK